MRRRTRRSSGYLAGLQSLYLERALDKTELEVYSHPILQRIIAGLRKLYGERDTRERQPITRDILLQLILRFDQTTLGGANLHARLGRGLVFDDEIAAQQERRSDAHPTPFREQRRVRDSRQFWGSGSLSRAG